MNRPDLSMQEGGMKMAAFPKEPRLPLAIRHLDEAVENLCSMVYELEGIMGLSQPPSMAGENVEMEPTLSYQRANAVDRMTHRLQCAISSLARSITEAKEL